MAIALASGSSQSISISTGLFDCNAAYTVAGWMYVSSMPGFLAGIFDVNCGFNLGDVLYFNSNGYLELVAINDPNSAAQNSQLISSGNWYHIAVVRTDSSNLKCYVDGVDSLNCSLSVSGRGTTSALMLGAHVYFGGRYLDGRLAGWKAWTRALTAAEVRAEMRFTLPASKQSLWEAWPFLRSSREKGYYYGRNWTETGSPTDGDPPAVGWSSPRTLTVLPESPPPLPVPGPARALRLTAANTEWVGRSSDLIDYNSAYTLMAWVRLESVPAFSERRLFDLSAGLFNNADQVRVDVGNSLFLATYVGGSETKNYSGLSCPTGEWVHVTMVREDSSNLRLYKNGSATDAGHSTVSMSGRTAATQLALSTDYGNPVAAWDGRIYACKAWTRALGLAEIQREMRQVLPVSHQSLYECWPFFENARTKGYYKGRDWTEYNTPTSEAAPALAWSSPRRLTVLPAEASGSELSLSGQTNGTSTAAALLAATLSLVSTAAAGTSTTAGLLGQTLSLVSTPAAGTSTTSGSISSGSEFSLAGAAAGGSTTAGLLQAIVSLSGISAGAGSTAGLLGQTLALVSVPAAGSSTATANLQGGPDPTVMTKTNFLENKLLDHSLGVASYTMPTTVYIGLFTAAPNEAGGGTEVTGGSYARAAATFSAASSGSSSNAAQIDFVSATASWGIVTHFGLFDAPSGGNLLRFAALPVSRSIGIGDVPYFAAGALTVTED